jgi:hypothetical protein
MIGNNRMDGRSTCQIGGIALALVVFAVSAHADWADDFDAGFAETWIFDAVDDIGNPPTTGSSTFLIVEDGADDYLRISHNTTANKDGGGGATDGFGLVNELFGVTGISADINAKPSIGQQNLLGVIARGDPLTGTAYVAAVDFANSFFAIGRSDDFFDFLVPLAIDSSVVIDSNQTYRVHFFLLGSSLTAVLTEASTGDVISKILAVDGFYASGHAGILVETEYDFNDFPVGPIIGSFDDVEAVPEPSMMSLIGWGVGALLWARKRRGGDSG